MNELRLYTIFHCNLNYSSIEEGQRPEVINQCYWPLIRLARQLALPVGIEMSGCTLEILNQLDPSLVEELRWLVSEGEAEFIGSGYSQIIAPLVPAELNAANLRLGHQTYQRILGQWPRVALINEQAYSAGLVPLYLEAGYRAVVMEWENPSQGHPEWDPNWRYLPQYAIGNPEAEIPLIWNSSISFQKFQRYASAEMDLEEYLEYLQQQRGEGKRAFPLYGNDAEVFGFRPGRYATEPPLSGEEWQRIHRLFERLQQDSTVTLCRPREVLELLTERGAGNPLHLETPDQPIPVKKQEKYNISRWATSGRDDIGINSVCWRIFHALSRSSSADESQWKELCYLWSSDFRTHITEQRWTHYQSRLDKLCRAVRAERPGDVAASGSTDWAPQRWVQLGGRSDVRSEGRFLVVETPDVRVRLNRQKGLTVEGAWFQGVSEQSLFGTLPHGYYPDIRLGADYYSGHLVLRRLAASQITTLSPAEPRVDREAEWLLVSWVVPTELGPVQQQLGVSLERPLLEFRYRLDWAQLPAGALRLGHITLNPTAFQKSDLYYRTCNGGFQSEAFRLGGQNVDHGGAVSYRVSARQGLGLTDGVVELGDGRTCLRVEVDQTISALLGLLTFQEVRELFFCRLEFSGSEVDETAHPPSRSPLEGRIRVSAHRSRRRPPDREVGPNAVGGFGRQPQLLEGGVPRPLY